MYTKINKMSVSNFQVSLEYHLEYHIEKRINIKNYKDNYI